MGDDIDVRSVVVQDVNQWPLRRQALCKASVLPVNEASHVPRIVLQETCGSQVASHDDLE